MILVGEPHPEFPLRVADPLAGTLGPRARAGLRAHRGFRRATWPPAISCSICAIPPWAKVPARLLRALGLGKAVLVSDVGSFQEFPDDVCLKVPVGAGEEDLIFEYLNLLVSRPDVAARAGRARRATTWRGECNWDRVARRYAAVPGGPWSRADEWQRAVAPQPAASGSRPAEPAPAPEPAPHEPEIPPEYVAQLGRQRRGRRAISKRTRRACVKTLEITPPGRPRRPHPGNGRVPANHARAALASWATAKCAAATTAPPGHIDHRERDFRRGRDASTCEIDHFDAEKDRFPYPDGHFSTVLCCELIEHLFEDPMHLMSEVNRILKPGGHLVLTTPNIGGAARHLRHPAGLPSRDSSTPTSGRAQVGEVDARHNREYTPQRDPPAAGELRASR